MGDSIATLNVKLKERKRKSYKKASEHQHRSTTIKGKKEITNRSYEPAAFANNDEWCRGEREKKQKKEGDGRIAGECIK